jgi:hypothetical protein
VSIPQFHPPKCEQLRQSRLRNKQGHCVDKRRAARV